MKENSQKVTGFTGELNHLENKMCEGSVKELDHLKLSRKLRWGRLKLPFQK